MTNIKNCKEIDYEAMKQKVAILKQESVEENERDSLSRHDSLDRRIKIIEDLIMNAMKKRSIIHNLIVASRDENDDALPKLISQKMEFEFGKSNIKYSNSIDDQNSVVTGIPEEAFGMNCPNKSIKISVLEQFIYMDGYYVEKLEELEKASKLFSDIRRAVITDIMDHKKSINLEALCEGSVFTSAVHDKDVVANIDYNSPIGNSDHIVLVFLLRHTWNLVRKRAKQKYNFNKGEYDKMRVYVRTELSKEMCVFKQVYNVVKHNEAWMYFCTVQNDATNKFIPLIDVGFIIMDLH
ncbi:hypothetical protein HELRODRAFT_158679 [Helobdella robusta]|uniref:Uncharacterized protein n=1 Tax=Helobdella robusta TaxID=6412 RepID=T1EN43_HELRO|nr:hypothetical protein HELRODRAFT_158679 [Helobdella robusta]ESO12212.1 hypothetical protein HELRODRAFT_158679 [Helobdella robusta]